MRQRGFIHGFSMALFGPRNRTAYASLGFDFSPEQMEEGARAPNLGLIEA